MTRLDWERDGRAWPHRDATRFVETRGMRWRVEIMGDGPAVLLLHGTGASAHSWRDVMPALAERFCVIAPDLPGHAFTRGRPAKGLTLAGMAEALSDLLVALKSEPVIVVGHSAGAAIALQLVGQDRPTVPVVGFNPALMPFPGLAAQMFPALAKMLFVNPLVPRIFAQMARAPGEPARFLARSTGSHIDEAGLRCYRILLANSKHCAGALEMMACWNLTELAARLPAIANPVRLVHSRGDTAIPLLSVEEACEAMSQCSLTLSDTCGHLAHEEDPGRAVDEIREFAARHAIPAEGGDEHG